MTIQMNIEYELKTNKLKINNKEMVVTGVHAVSSIIENEIKSLKRRSYLVENAK